jgi:glutathione S-transferase
VTRVTDRPSFKKARADQLAHFAKADESRSAAGQ